MCLKLINISLLVFLISGTVKAADDNLHELCQRHYFECLQLIDKEYQELEPGSHLWLQVQNYRMDAMYQLGDLEEMLALTTQLVNAAKLPLSLKLTAHIYHAKMLEFFGEREDALVYIDKSTHLFKQLNNNYPSPIRLVELANLQLLASTLKLKENKIDEQLKILKQAEQTLLDVEKRFRNDTTIEFRQELYTNFGHIYRYLDNQTEAIRSFEKALFWFKQSKNLQQIAIGYYNVGRGYQQNDNVIRAMKAFQMSADYSMKANDEQSLVYSYIRILQMAMLAQDQAVVDDMENKLKNKSLNLDHQRLYDAVQVGLN